MEQLAQIPLSSDLNEAPREPVFQQGRVKFSHTQKKHGKYTYGCYRVESVGRAFKKDFHYPIATGDDALKDALANQTKRNSFAQANEQFHLGLKLFPCERPETCCFARVCETYKAQISELERQLNELRKAPQPPPRGDSMEDVSGNDDKENIGQRGTFICVTCFQCVYGISSERARMIQQDGTAPWHVWGCRCRGNYQR